MKTCKIFPAAFGARGPIGALRLLTLGAAAVVVAALCILPSLHAAESEAASDDRVAQLIELLGHSEFLERERAQEELLKLGPEAYDALQGAIDHEDIEIATRARYLVRMIRIDWTREGDSPRVKELLKGYDGLAANVRLERVGNLSELPGDAGVPALCRIVRFERSPVIAKRAALTLLARPLPPGQTADERRKQMLETLGRSNTPASNWLRLEAQTLADPEAAVEQWSKAVAEEQAALAAAPQTTQMEIVVGLLRRQVDLLMQLERHEEAQAAMIRCLDYEPGTPESLLKLLDWLVEHKAWKVADAVEQRFADRFLQQPLLMYLLADVRKKQGQDEQAEQTASKALEATGNNAYEHYKVARELQQRGLFDWTLREYRRAIELGPAPNPLVTFASQSAMAELLHDQQRHLEGAEVLKPAVEELEKNAEHRQSVRDRLGRELGGIKSRMHYMYAMDFLAKNDLAKCTEHLDKAIEADPTDADVLIALYRLPNQDAERRKKTLDLINAAADVFRRQIRQSPDDSTAYNQFAWLIGNTEGDYKEALQYSQKSLELLPGAAGYLDTLGRCYYAVGDLENALKYQTQAVTLEPHSGAMQRQLAFFKEEAAKKQKQ